MFSEVNFEVVKTIRHNP